MTVATRLPCDARILGPVPELAPAGLRQRDRTTPEDAALLGVPYGREGQHRYGTEVNGCSRSMYQLVLVVTNIGCGTANPSTFRFQRKDGTFITYPVGSLVPDASARFTILSYTYSGGEYARTATADFTHVVAESNENDNTAYWNCIL